jgi:hypothetical protein
MKSTANQYKDLKEGRMSQANFMRNLRMSMPQYITNTTSFNDAVRILKNKAILTEVYYDPGLEPRGLAKDPGQEDDKFWDRVEIGLEREGIKGLEEFVLNMDVEEFEKVMDGAESSDDAVNTFVDLFLQNKSMEQKIQDYGEEESGKYTKFDDFEGGLSEGRKKKEPKQPLHPNQIHPSELRMGIKVEMEHTGDPKKAEKIALDHLAENPYYYTALKLSGIESPSAPKAKAPVAAKKVKKKDATEMVDTANQMQKVKMSKKVVNEVRINAMPGEETNATMKHAMQYIDSDIANPTLKALSDKLELQPLRDNRAILRYGYWEEMPAKALDAVKLQFNVEEDTNSDEETAPQYIYIISSKKKSGNLGSSLETGANKASQIDTFKEALEKLVRKTLAETFDGKDDLANITDYTK